MTATHRLTAPAALLLGAALGLVARWGKPAATAGIAVQEKESASPSAHTVPETSRSHSSATTPRLRVNGSAAAYAAAWETLKDGKLPH